MAQIAAALGTGSPSGSGISVAGDLLSLVVTSGHNADTVTAQSIVSLTGAISGFRVSFYADNTTVTVTSTWQYFPFGFKADYISFHTQDTTSTHNLRLSVDGINELAVMQGNSVADQGYSLILMSERVFNLRTTGIWMKYSTALATPWRLSAWMDQP